MNAAAALAAASLGTLALRQVSVRALARRALPPSVDTTLRHAALAVMAALVAASLPASGRLGVPSGAALAALALTGLVARRTRNTAASIATGAAVFAVATALGWPR